MYRILTVDDDPDILMVVRFLLESEGYEVTTLESPAAVLPELSRQAYDLAILDVMMPGMTGWQVLQQIREQQELCTIPVMMLTAMGEDGARQQALQAGADDFLKKPFKPAELLKNVRRTLEHRPVAASLLLPACRCQPAKPACQPETAAPAE
jgi:DNA-binding response OmpR family regulator